MAIKVMRTGSADYGRYVKMLLAGEPGAGKTRFGRTWPNVFYANAEGGVMSVAADRVPYTTIKASSDMQELLRILDQDPAVRERILGVPVETLVIDTLDEVQRILAKERVREQRRDAMQRDDWGWLGDQLRGMVRALRNLEMNVIFTCHVKETSDEQTGAVTIKPALQGAMGDEIPGYVDLALLLNARSVARVEGDKTVRRIVRTLQTYPDQRHPWIKDRSGKLPMDFEVDFETDFKRLDTAIFADLDQLAATETLMETGPEAEPEPEPEVVETKQAQHPSAKKAAAAKKAAPKTEKAAEKPAEEPAAAPETPQATLTEAPPATAAPTDLPPADEPEEDAEPAPEHKPQPTETPATEPETQPAREEAVPSSGTAEETPAEASSGPGTCEVCGDAIEDVDQADLSYIRFRKRMDRKCFAEAKKNRK